MDHAEGRRVTSWFDIQTHVKTDAVKGKNATQKNEESFLFRRILKFKICDLTGVYRYWPNYFDYENNAHNTTIRLTSIRFSYFTIIYPNTFIYIKLLKDVFNFESVRAVCVDDGLAFIYHLVSFLRCLCISIIVLAFSFENLLTFSVFSFPVIICLILSQLFLHEQIFFKTTWNTIHTQIIIIMIIIL